MRHGADTIEVERWGKDHWSTFMYIETRVVDHGGTISPPHMRDDGNKYPTKLADGEKQKGHNDWDCLEDLEAAKLIEHSGGTGLNPIYSLTPEGWYIAGKLRRWRAEGNPVAQFKDIETAPAAKTFTWGSRSAVFEDENGDPLCVVNWDLLRKVLNWAKERL